MAQRFLDHEVRFAHRRVDLADRGATDVGDIVRPVLVHARRAGTQGRLGGGDGRQRFVIDADRLHRLGERARIGCDNHGNRLADMAHDVFRQHRLLIGAEFLLRLVRRDRARHFGQVGRREGVGDAVQVHFGNSRVRMRASHHAQMQHAGTRDVVDEARTTGEQRYVLLAADRFADHAGRSSRSHRSGMVSSMPRNLPSAKR